MNALKKLLVGLVLCAGLGSEAFASGADGILCTAPLPLAVAPSPAAQVVRFAGEWKTGDHYVGTLWREPCGPGVPGGIVYARFNATTGTPDLCDPSYTVLQGGLAFTVKFALQSDGPTECGPLSPPYTFVVEPLSFPYYGTDEAFTLVFRGENSVSGATLPSYVAPSTSIVPQAGLWWNPAESGSGYALDFKHGLLVVTIYSYTSFGAPLWYLAVGPIVGDTFTASLEKYAGGQCISCAYQAPRSNGNDGEITMRFDSPTSATMTLPGGRAFTVVAQSF